MAYDPKRIEEEVRGIWAKNKIPESVVEFSAKKKFYLLDGPPYVNASAHVGHIKTTTFKDVWGKFKFMQGYGVWFQPGFDCGGLPIENKVEKKLDLRRKSDIEAIGIGRFISECRAFAKGHEAEWLEIYRKIGAWRGYVEPYLTSDNSYRESGWWTVKRMFDKGLLVRGEKPTFWCPHCETVLSGYDVTDSYRDIESPSIYIKFKVKGKNEFFLVWTTTPWTLPANVALCVHPDEIYMRAEVEGEVLIMAEERRDLLEALGKDYVVVEKFKGSELEGMGYESLLDIPLQKELEAGHKVIVSIPLMKKKASGKVAAKKETGDEEGTQFGHLVDISTGTGIVHIAPGHGEEDHRIGEHYKLPSPSPVDEAGRLTEDTGIFSGMKTEEATESVLERLAQKDTLFHSEKIVHSYPLCWRCKTPLIYRKTKQWFLRLDTLREKILHENKSVNWLPEFAREQFRNVIESAPDWAITRQRYWGIPFPLWVCQKCGSEKMVGGVEELKDSATERLPENLQLSVDFVDKIKLKCGCGGEMEREREVMDVWFDSGISPWASLGYPYQNKELFEKLWPVDLIDESLDQVRGWFYSLMVCGVSIFDEKPYKTVCLNGWNLDDKGEKMSKSIGNVVWGEEAYDELGADALRIYLCFTNAPWESQKFSFDEAKQMHNYLNTLWNLSAFAGAYGNICEGGQSSKSDNLADKWLISRINSLIKEATEDFENFRFHYASRKILRFMVDDFSRIYVKLARDRIEKDKSVSGVFIYTFERLLKLLAPFAPFASESLYFSLFGESVHKSAWPEYDERFLRPILESSFESAKEITEAINAERQKNGVGLRLPIIKATVYGDERAKEAVENAKDIICALSNLKEVYFERSDNVEIKPNFASLGRKFGKRTQEVAKLISAMQPKDISDKMVVEGYEIEKEDLLIRQKNEEGTEFKGGYIVLDLTEDENLKSERFIRELVRKIQQARKENKLSVSDGILLYLDDNPVFKDWEKAIMEGVGAKEICYARKSGKGKATYKDLEAQFGFEKVP
jgi:isoleucyl-tRNA synthetase